MKKIYIWVLPVLRVYQTQKWTPIFGQPLKDGLIKSVIPAKAGIQVLHVIPASAGIPKM
jgi:hypothetical protein